MSTDLPIFVPRGLSMSTLRELKLNASPVYRISSAPPPGPDLTLELYDLHGHGRSFSVRAAVAEGCLEIVRVTYTLPDPGIVSRPFRQSVAARVAWPTTYTPESLIENAHQTFINLKAFLESHYLAAVRRIARQLPDSDLHKGAQCLKEFIRQQPPPSSPS